MNASRINVESTGARRKVRLMGLVAVVAETLNLPPTSKGLAAETRDRVALMGLEIEEVVYEVEQK